MLGHTENIYAKLLVTTFKRLALEWYMRLLPWSITSYDELIDKFLHQFASKKQTRLLHTNLYSVKQGEDESTRYFITRFDNEVLKVDSPIGDFLTDVIYLGLGNKMLAGALAREKPRRMERLLAVKDSYINEEEMSKLKYGVREKKAKGKDKETKNKERGMSLIKCFHNYAPLAITRKEIFLAIKDENLLKMPKKILVLSHTKNFDKYCLFHKQNGHDTKDYCQLKDEIERLIQRGYLKKFTSKLEEKQSEKKDRIDPKLRRERLRSPRRGVDDQLVRGVIDTIAGGPISEDLKSTRKQLDRKIQNRSEKLQRTEIFSVSNTMDLISFGPQDEEHLSMTATNKRIDCPMVVTLEIAHYNVKKVLIDNEISANIIFYSTLQKMDHGKLNMSLVRTPLVEFKGSEIMHLGTVKLITSFGWAPRRKTLVIPYLVVDAPFAYNVIIG